MILRIKYGIEVNMIIYIKCVIKKDFLNIINGRVFIKFLWSIICMFLCSIVVISKLVIGEVFIFL